MEPKGGWVYIMTNRPNGVLYIGVTADLIRRVYEHRTGAVKSFSKKYNLERLVYFERHEEILLAIAREKAMKKWRREWKVELIEKTNPGWNDLYDQIA
jgi:putative endonuclease